MARSQLARTRTDASNRSGSSEHASRAQHTDAHGRIDELDVSDATVDDTIGDDTDGFEAVVAPGVEPDSEIRRRVRPPRTPYTLFVKQAVDRSVAAVALFFAAIPMAVISGVILVTMGRPVFFRQRRVGLDGEVFSVLKFRTMRPDRRQRDKDVNQDRRITHKTTADPRHTPTGQFLRKFSLDELPQLVNVVRGEMSIVGPRPELEGVVGNYDADLHQRHLVRPGLTGLWQVSARGDGPMHENGEWDLDYVEQVSLRTDMSIIARTPTAMLGENRGS